MKNVVIILLAVIALVLTIACNDSNSSDSDLIGIYAGTFTVVYANGETFSNPVEVTFEEENKYQSSGNNDYIPAGGSGTYQRNDTSITFEDTNFWTANFDWNLILAGQYDYSLDGDKLTISAEKNDVGFYKYELTKQ